MTLVLLVKDLATGGFHGTNLTLTSPSFGIKAVSLAVDPGAFASAAALAATPTGGLKGGSNAHLIAAGPFRFVDAQQFENFFNGGL